MNEIIYKLCRKSSMNVNQTENLVTESISQACSFDEPNKKFMKTLYRILLVTVGILTAVLSISVIL